MNLHKKNKIHTRIYTRKKFDGYKKVDKSKFFLFKNKQESNFKTTI